MCHLHYSVTKKIPNAASMTSPPCEGYYTENGFHAWWYEWIRHTVHRGQQQDNTHNDHTMNGVCDIGQTSTGNGGIHKAKQNKS